jgi:hypothetical protein
METESPDRRMNLVGRFLTASSEDDLAKGSGDQTMSLSTHSVISLLRQKRRRSVSFFLVATCAAVSLLIFIRYI